MNFDYVIAGAGIIGLTTAREILNRQPNTKLLILEKEALLGVHASGRNSGVLHTGIYYPAETLKAKFCKKGADSLFQYATENKIPVRKDGKVIVASSENNALGLNKLMQNAKTNGIDAVLMDESDLKQVEPYAFSEYGGIYCKDTAVIDSNQVLVALKKEIEFLGGKIWFGQEIKSVDDCNKVISTSKLRINYSYFINAAGAFADNIAKMMGVGAEYQLIPFKGLYYKLSPEQSHRVKGSIYPVPDPSLPFLGIHFTRSIDGSVYVGPTAIPAFGRENYGLLSGLNLKESVSIFSQLARLYVANTQNFRDLVGKELPHLSKKGFMNSAKGLVRDLKPEWLQSTPKIGIRPQLINTKEKKLEMDFLMERGEHSLHVLNSISPAFTSSFAVAEHIVDELNI
ncbi:MAG: L-2-hydroxyglutarate oxidase [Colwellia sp.]